MFDICATFILGRAYENFPVPAEVDMSALYKKFTIDLMIFRMTTGGKLSAS
jgi:hypothetical protein